MKSGTTAAPHDRFYESHGLRLHYVDWGNESAPPLYLIHGGRDHCRSWDRMARALQPHFHVIAPDLRGHGDSDWTRGGSYALSEYAYDLSRLMREIGGGPANIVGHSMGGMVGLIYTGSFPEQVSKLVVLDGVTVMPDQKRAPTHERMARYVSQLDQLHGRAPHRFDTIEQAAERMVAHNKRLSPELALHLATHGVRREDDGAYVWKFDPTQRVAAPHRLWPEDHVALWNRIACPALLMVAQESMLGNSKAAPGLAQYFRDIRIETVADAGHWLQHDKPDEVLRSVADFLGARLATT